MAKTKIICDGVTRVCYTCKTPYPIECFHLRKSRDGVFVRHGRCKFCYTEYQSKRNSFLLGFHRNAKLVLSEEIYEQIKQMQK